MQRHAATLSDDELLALCEVAFLRRSGPGGQHRNKVDTAVRLKHAETGIVAEASERRSQAANRRVALKRLRVKLALEVRLPAGDDRQPSALWQSRRRNRRIAVSADHADYPACVAEALDWLAHFGYETRPAAERLGVTTSQLVALLRKDPAVLQTVNDRREAADLGRLH